MIANPRVQSALSRWSRLLVLSCGLSALTLLPVQGQQQPPKSPPNDSPTDNLEFYYQIRDVLQPLSRFRNAQPNASKQKLSRFAQDLEGQIEQRLGELVVQSDGAVRLLEPDLTPAENKKKKAAERAKLKALFEQFLEWREQRTKMMFGEGINSDAGVTGQLGTYDYRYGIEFNWDAGQTGALGRIAKTYRIEGFKAPAKPDDSKAKNGPGTKSYHKPNIKNAKLVSWLVEDSARAYFLKTKQAAASFAKTVTTFKLATQFELIVSDTEPSVYDADKHKLVISTFVADHIGINSDKVILLVGTPKQHARVEQLMRALGAAE